jgi:hypothetical protein
MVHDEGTQPVRVDAQGPDVAAREAGEAGVAIQAEWDAFRRAEDAGVVGNEHEAAQHPAGHEGRCTTFHAASGFHGDHLDRLDRPVPPLALIELIEPKDLAAMSIRRAPAG